MHGGRVLLVGVREVGSLSDSEREPLRHTLAVLLHHLVVLKPRQEVGRWLEGEAVDPLVVVVRKPPALRHRPNQRGVLQGTRRLDRAQSARLDDIPENLGRIRVNWRTKRGFPYSEDII